MARKGQTPRREILPDPKYKDRLVGKFINKLLLEGKKSIAEQIVYDALQIISEKTKEDPLKVFKDALDNVKPVLEVRSRRVGGATYQVPVEVRPDRRVALGMRWIVLYSRERGEKSMEEKLAGEILDAYQKRGSAIRKREDVHKMAEANKAFAHYRW
ncbi:MAG: 30S ribosomal protein S7 [Deltaproteobacteria bacterium]|nr:30S ribosomal protein S7 [Deltaproteobacteria bacterium]